MKKMPRKVSSDVKSKTDTETLLIDGVLKSLSESETINQANSDEVESTKQSSSVVGNA